jgi:glycosyltransferase involved in cell wall biosynthesis
LSIDVKNICIDISPLDMDASKRGIGIYASLLLKGIQDSKKTEQSFSCLRFKKGTPAIRFPEWKLPLSHCPERLLWLASALSLKPFLISKGINIFHSTHPYNIPISKYYKTIATAYDLIPFIFYDKYLKHKKINAKLSYRYQLQQLKRVHHLIAISEQTKRDCVEYLGIDENRISTVYLAVDPNIFKKVEDAQSLENVRKKFSLSNKFFFFVGGADYRKNLRGLVNAYSMVAKGVEEDLVLVGHWYSDWIKSLNHELEQLKIQNRVKFLSFVQEDELNCLYSMSTALLFPSLYEGFGFPVLEAFSCQTPVLCSNNSSLIEIAKDCAVLVDPYQEDDIAQGIVKIAKDEKLREELSVKGYNRSKDYSIEKMTRETIEVYRNI